MAEIVRQMPVQKFAETQGPIVPGNVITTSGLTGGSFIHLRRRELYLLADAWGVDYPHDCPATEMRILLEKARIDPNGTPPRPIAAKPKPRPEEPAAETVVEDEYAGMAFNDLRRVCKNRGIPIRRGEGGDDLRAKLRNGQDTS